MVLAVWGAVSALPAGDARAAQCRLCSAEESPGTAEAEAGSMAIEVQTSLDFDRLVLIGPSGGTARLGADGSRITSGAIGQFSGRAMAGSVVIRGEPNRPVRIDLPERITLDGWNGGRIVIEDIGSNLPSSPRLDGNGRLSFRFGGELRVDGESEGDYRGEVPITVEYL